MEKRQPGYRGEQQAPEIARLQEELGRKPNLVQVLSAPSAAKPGQVGKLTPAQDRWVKHVENQAILVTEMKPILDDIKEIIARNNYDTGFVSALTGDLDPSLLTGDSQLLYHRFNALLSKQMAAETTGRGSDLLRGVIKAGKLNLGLEPENIKTLISNLEREFQRKELESEKTAEYIASGKPPLDLGQKVRQEAIKALKVETTKKPLSSAELSKLPKEVLQLKDGQEAIGDDGKVIAYRENGKFYKG